MACEKISLPNKELLIQFQLQPILLFFNLSESEHKAHITVISITSLQNTNVTLIWLSELTALSDHRRTCVPRNGTFTASPHLRGDISTDCNSRSNRARFPRGAICDDYTPLMAQYYNLLVNCLVSCAMLSLK